MGPPMNKYIGGHKVKWWPWEYDGFPLVAISESRHAHCLYCFLSLSRTVDYAGLMNQGEKRMATREMVEEFTRFPCHVPSN